MLIRVLLAQHNPSLPSEFARKPFGLRAIVRLARDTDNVRVRPRINHYVQLQVPHAPHVERNYAVTLVERVVA